MLSRPDNCPQHIWDAASEAERRFIVAHECLHAIHNDDMLRLFTLLLGIDTPLPRDSKSLDQLDRAVDARIIALLAL